MALSKDHILSAEDRPRSVEKVPEWCPHKPDGVAVCTDETHDHDVILRGISGLERIAFDQENIKQVGDEFKWNPQNIQARLLAKSIVDEDGNRIFNDQEALNLGAKSASVLSRLYAAAQKLNGMGAEDGEELKGNSEAAQSGDSPSDSQQKSSTAE